MAGELESVTRLTTGSVAFEAGADSSRIPTIVAEDNPYGLKYNQSAWFVNATCRGGGIHPRPGYFKLAAFELNIGLFQEAILYQPNPSVPYPEQQFGTLGGFPYIVTQIGGRTWRVRVDTDNSIDELTRPGDANPADLDKSWMCQGEQFLIIQDGESVPLIWDGTTLIRTTDLENYGTYLTIPTGECMDYYMGRLWVANGREYLAGDIVRGPSGTGAYGLRDSILYANENTFIANGGVFVVPTLGGNIRALAHSANLDTVLGEGQLFVFTRQQIYSCNVVPTRAEWINLKDPIQRIAQINFGTTGDRSVVNVNGDLFFQSMDGVRSLTVAIRHFQQWGNTPISVEETRAIKFNDRELLRFGSGIEFNNRLLQTALPYQTDVGVVHRALMPLDFNTISSLNEKLPPVWEGIWEGLDFLQVLQGDFGGRQRAFAMVRSRTTGGIEVWEISQNDLFDGDDNRISWSVETPSFTWNRPFTLKELDTMELWIDELYGTVEFVVEYREGQNPCWRPWHSFSECAARNECEDWGALQPCDYPTQVYSLQYRQSITLPKARGVCDSTNNRPSNIGYSFQVRLKMKGYCRIRGFLIHALERGSAPYEGIRC